MRLNWASIITLLGCALATPVYAQTGTVQTAAQLNREILSSLASAQSPPITALQLRQVLVDMVASLNLTTVAATGSTTARTLADRFAEAVNVKDFGALCDGSTDDRAAFVAANTAASSAGKSLFVPAGTCMISANFSLSNSVGMIGIPGRSVLKQTAANSSGLITSTTGSNHVYGITFDGNSSGSTHKTTLATVFSASNVVFDTDTFQNSLGIGILFSTSVTFSGVRNSKFRNIGAFSDPVIANRGQGIDFCCGTASANTNNFANDNDFYQFGLDAISIDSQYYFISNNNRFSTSGTPQLGAGIACIYATANHYLTIVGNDCYNASGNGIDSFGNTGVAITGNVSALSGGSGILTANDTDTTVTGNTSVNNRQLLGVGVTGSAGVTVNGVCANVQITGNVLADDQASHTQSYGIEYFTSSPGTGACTNLNISSNTYNGNVIGATTSNLPQIPGSSAVACSAGEISWDTSFVYICSATNTFRRAALSAF